MWCADMERRGTLVFHADNATQAWQMFILWKQEESKRNGYSPFMEKYFYNVDTGDIKSLTAYIPEDKGECVWVTISPLQSIYL